MYEIREISNRIVEYLLNGSLKMEVGYYRNGNIKHIWYWRNNCIKFKGPTYIEYYGNGFVKDETYFKGNNLHNIEDPAVRNYNEDGTILREQFWIAGK